MALRSSAQGHRLDFAGPYPASSRPLSVCGFVRVIENANTWATLVGLGQDADINLTQLGLNTGNTSNLQLVCYQVTPTWNEILETVNTGLSIGQDFFWGISFPSGTAKPTFFWRALSTPTLSTSTPGGTAGTWTFTPSRLSLNYLSGLLAGEWANARQSGVRLWNRTMTAGEMLSESFSLRARNRQGLVLDAPCILDGRDLSQFGAGRVGTITGMTVEPGPPVGWGSSIIAIPAAASNATYNEDTTDSGALTDASAAMMLLVGSASDSGVLTDTASGQRVSGDAISDSGALTDTAAGGLALAASASDSGALTDAATGAVSAAEVVSDSGAGSDTAASTWVVGESVTDAADVTDQVTDVGIWLEAASDSAAATDAAMDTLASVDSLADSVATTDTATAALVVAEVLSDSVEATDSAAGQAIYAEAVSDSADLSDTTTGDSGLDVSVIDSAEASESVSTSLIASDALADAAESSDGVVVTAVYQEVVSDSLSATESVVESVGGHSYFESVEDALEASDSTLATLLSFGASVRSQGGGSGGGRLWTRDLDDEIEAEMGAILKGPPLTSEVIEEITARLDSPPQTRIMEHRRPAKATYSPPVLDFQAVQAKKRRNRQRLLLLL